MGVVHLEVGVDTALRCAHNQSAVAITADSRGVLTLVRMVRSKAIGIHAHQ